MVFNQTYPVARSAFTETVPATVWTQGVVPTSILIHARATRTSLLGGAQLQGTGLWAEGG